MTPGCHTPYGSIPVRRRSRGWAGRCWSSKAREGVTPYRSALPMALRLSFVRDDNRSPLISERPCKGRNISAQGKGRRRRPPPWVPVPKTSVALKGQNRHSIVSPKDNVHQTRSHDVSIARVARPETIGLDGVRPALQCNVGLPLRLIHSPKTPRIHLAIGTLCCCVLTGLGLLIGILTQGDVPSA